MKLTPAEIRAAIDGTIVWNAGHYLEGLPIGKKEFKRRKHALDKFFGSKLLKQRGSK